MGNDESCPLVCRVRREMVATAALTARVKTDATVIPLITNNIDHNSARNSRICRAGRSRAFSRNEHLRGADKRYRSIIRASS